ncbi:MAG: Excinuclease ABC subunit A, partial [uncultured Phycisphaerae bacterium]
HAEDLQEPHRPRPAQDGHRPRVARQGHRHRPVADRAHPPVQPGHLHGRLRLDPQAVHPDDRGQGPGLPARAVQLQRQGRALRELRRRRHHQDRDALPARRVRPLRGLQGRPLQPRHARHPLQGQEHRRGARHALRGGARVLRQPAVDQPPPPDHRRRRPRLRAPRPARPHPLRGRGPAGQARLRAGQAVDRPHHLRPRRADDRPPLRGHPPPAHRARPARRPGQHRARHRAQPRRHQDRRLDHRPRPRGRRRRWHGGGRGHPRAGGQDRGQPHRQVPRPAARGV